MREDCSGSRGSRDPGIRRAGSEPVPGSAHARPPSPQRPGLGVLLGGRGLLPRGGELLRREHLLCQQHYLQVKTLRRLPPPSPLGLPGGLGTHYSSRAGGPGVTLTRAPRASGRSCRLPTPWRERSWGSTLREAPCGMVAGRPYPIGPGLCVSHGAGPQHSVRSGRLSSFVSTTPGTLPFPFPAAARI